MESETRKFVVPWVLKFKESSDHGFVCALRPGNKYIDLTYDTGPIADAIRFFRKEDAEKCILPGMEVKVTAIEDK